MDEKGATTPAGVSTDLRGLRVRLINFGCQMNKYDSRRTAELLAACGAKLTDDDKNCDWLLFNTCAVRGHAEERLASRLGAARRLVETGRLKVGVLGCVPQIETEHLKRRFPFVSFFAGTRAFAEVPRLMAAVEAGASTPLTELGTEQGVFFPTVPKRRGNFPTAFLTVARGCNKRCSYCVVPYTRGEEKSRPLDEIVREAEELTAAGTVELTLLGQTIDTYGRDLAPAVDLAALLRRLYSLSELRRLRFITNHPAECGEDLFRVMADLGDKVMPFIHMPPQSGDDTILARMSRGYDRARYLKVVDSARRLCPEIEIGGDWIVGFCGEDDAAFQRSVSLLEEVGFQNGYVFKYSPRRVTPAYGWPDDVPEALKKERHRTLLATQEEVSFRKNRARVGTTEEVLVAGRSKQDKTRLTGRTRTNRLLHFHDLPAADGRSATVGEIVRAQVTDATALCLLGERVSG